MTSSLQDASPDVTVIIPTCDRWHRLQRTLSVALTQRGVNIEVVVVDDGSVDGTREGLHILAESDPRVRPVRHEHSQGLAKARNAGLRLARADWVAFLDDDDLWSPHKLRRQLDAAALGGASWAYAGVVVVDDKLVARALAPPGDPSVALERLLVEPWIQGSSNVIVRTDVVGEMGGFDESLPHLADWDMWIRLAQHAAPATCPEMLVAYVEHNANMHLDADIETTFDELQRLRAKHEKARLDRGVDLDERGFAHWVAGSHVRAGRRWRSAYLHARLALRHRAPAELVGAVRACLRHRVGDPGRGGVRVEAPEWLQEIANAAEWST